MQGQRHEQNRDLVPVTPRLPLSTCFLMCSGGDQTCRHFRNSTVLGLRMGLLCLVADERRTGETLPQNHLWIPVLRSEVRCRDRPALTSGALFLPTDLFHRNHSGRTHRCLLSPEMTLGMPQLFWDNLTMLAERGNTSYLNRTNIKDNLIVLDSLGFILTVTVMLRYL